MDGAASAVANTGHALKPAGKPRIAGRRGMPVNAGLDLSRSQPSRIGPVALAKEGRA
jgi:hypothetical protein